MLLDEATELINIDFQDWPRCAKCDMPVEQFEGLYTQTELIFVAKCHQAQETVAIPHEVWDDLDPNKFELTEAFRME